jgi:hypothetical protein
MSKQTRAWLGDSRWSRRDFSASFHVCADGSLRDMDVPADEVPLGATQTVQFRYRFPRSGRDPK